MSKTINCPECDNKIVIPDDAVVGDIITCVSQLSESDEGCLAEFEIISVEPLQIAPLEEEK